MYVRLSGCRPRSSGCDRDSNGCVETRAEHRYLRPRRAPTGRGGCADLIASHRHQNMPDSLIKCLLTNMDIDFQ